MARRNRSFFFDNISKRLVQNTSKTAKEINIAVAASVIANTDILTSKETDTKISTAINATGINTLSDISITSVASDQILQYNANTGNWENENFDFSSYSTTTEINTAIASSNTAMKNYVDAEVSGIVNSAPTTLDTLNELAAALGDDPDFATTTAANIGTKLAKSSNLSDLTNAATARTNLGLGTAATTASTDYATSAQGTKADTAHGWGNHASAGYGTSSFSGAYADLSGKPSLFSGAYADLSGKPSLFSGAYADLSGKPTIPTNNNQLTNGAGYITTAFINSASYQVASTWTSNATLSNRLTTAPDTAGDSSGISAFYMSSSATNKPTGTDHSLLTMAYSSAWQTQIAADWRNSGRLYVRGQNNGTWSAWNTVWDSGNDGSGSGLDADTLDGVQGLSFLRSDADDTVSKQLTFPSSIGDRPILPGGFLSRLSSDGDADIWGISETYYPSAGSSNAYGIRWASTPNEVQFVGANANKLRIDLDTAGGVYIDDNIVWHAGNDGSGSGLDADTLDGIQGAGFVKQLSDSTSGPNYLTPSSRRVDPNAANPTNEHHAISTFGNGGNVSGQLATHYVSGQAYTRGYNSAWSAWRKQWDSLNDGSGSGLDADTVDGLQATSFLRSDAEATSSTSLILAEDWSSGTYNSQFVIQGSYPSWETRGTSAQPYGWLHHQDSGGNYTLYSIAGYTGNSWTQRYYFGKDGIFRNGGSAGNVYYHQGNDGSGSGLDADTVDGLQAASFLRSDASDVTSGNLQVTGATYGGISIGETNTNYEGWNRQLNVHGTGHARIHVKTANVRMGIYAHDSWHGGVMGHVGTYTNHQLSFICNANQRAVLTTGGSLSTTVQGTLWGATNDGSGSGLDADLLDGMNSSSSVVANTIVSRQGNGYIYANHINFSTSETENPTINSFFVSNGDGWSRKASKSHVVSQLGVLPLAGGTMTGELNVSRNTGVGSTSAPSYSQGMIEVQTSDNSPPAIGFHRGGYSATTLYEYDGEFYASAWVARGQTGKLVSSGNIGTYAWTSSNDGSGSGLDADTLDGYQLSAIKSNSSADTNNIWIRNTSPTIYFRDTDHRGCMLHNNSNLFYVLRGSQATDSTSWGTTGGVWPMIINLTNNDVTFGGNVTAYSDIRLKKNVKPIGITLEQFKSVEAKRFDWKSDGKHDVGFIAQDVEAAGLVEVVKETENRDPKTGELFDTYKTLDYSRMVPFLWDIVQKQQVQIEELMEKIK